MSINLTIQILSIKALINTPKFLIQIFLKIDPNTFILFCIAQLFHIRKNSKFDIIIKFSILTGQKNQSFNTFFQKRCLLLNKALIKFGKHNDIILSLHNNFLIIERLDHKLIKLEQIISKPNP